MKSEEARTNNMSKPSTTLHAHIDCSEGINCNALLAACLGARGSSSKDRDELESLFDRITGIAFGVHPLFEMEEVDHYHRLVMERDHIKNDRYSWYAHRLIEVLKENTHISGWVKEISIAVFEELDEAEHKLSKLGNQNIPQLVTDAAVDVIGTLWCLEQLGVKSISFTPIPMPKNPQWTAILKECLLTPELLKGLPVSIGVDSIPWNTGAGVALLKVLNSKMRTYDTAPEMKFYAMTTGAATRQKRHVVKLTLGKALERDVLGQTCSMDRMTLLEANLDDMTPEHLAFCVDILMEEGAADAWVTSIIMKKGRAAQTLHCLCTSEKVDDLLPIVFRYSSTLGVRIQHLDRVALPRKMLTVQTEWTNTKRKGQVDVKVGYMAGEAVSFKAEYDHCKEIALESGATVQDIASQAVQRAQVQLKASDV